MIKQKIFLFLTIFSMIFLGGCQTYTQENAAFRNEMYAGDFQKSLTTLDKSSLASENRNYALFRMEKGMLLYLNGDYDSAIKSWTDADHKLDDLYTTSLSRTAASFIINDSMSDYSGEAHERILLPLFSSLAFFQNNDPNNSLVMVRRTYDIMKSLDDDSDGQSLLKNDMFSHYFSAMVYESKTDWDNAIVEYRLALKNTNGSGAAKTQILQSLGRLAEFRRRSDVLDLVQKEDSSVTWEKQNSLIKKGELYIVYESGKLPIKVPKEFPVPTDKTILKISFPEYQDVPYKTHSTEIFLDNESVGKTIVMEDIGKMAKKALSNRRIRDFAKMAARVIAKDLAARKLADENPLAGLGANIFNILTEVADTRSWTTLPDTIQIFRVPVPANQSSIVTLKPEFSDPVTFTVNLKPGEKKLYRFRTSQ